MLRRFVGAADLLALGVVFDVLHEHGVHMAALFDDHALPLIVEHPDLVAGVAGIGLAVDARLVQTAELRAPLRRVQQVAGAVLVKLILDSVLFELFPVFIGDSVYILGIQHALCLPIG